MSVFEISFKLGITAFLIVVIVILISLCVWIWNQQIDSKESFKQFFTTNVKGIFGWIATRDKNAIYQNRKIVGRVSGKVQKTDDKIVFSEIYDITSLNLKEPIEYQRHRLKIVEDGNIIGQKIVATNEGTEVKKNIRTNVVCVRIK